MFQELYAMMNQEQMLTINLLKKGDNLIVCVLPRCENVKDEALKHIVPLNLEGTPTELEEGFISAISNPVRKVSSMLKNMADFEAKADQVAIESKALKDQADKVAKLVKEAESLEKDKPQEALAMYKKALEVDKYNSKILSKVAQLEEKTRQGSLFAVESAAGNGAASVSQNPIKPNAEQHTHSAPVVTSLAGTTIETSEDTITQSSPVDMFAEVLKQEAKPQSQEAESQPLEQDVAPQTTAMPAMTPEMLSQFQQFMAFQQQQSQ